MKIQTLQDRPGLQRRRGRHPGWLLAFLCLSAQAAPGDPLTAPIAVSDGTAAPYLYSAVARAGDGTAVVVYDSVLGVLARRFDAGGAPLGGDVLVNQTSGARLPDVAANAAGDFIVSWSHLSGDDAPAILARRFHADGVAAGGEFVVAPPLETPLGGQSWAVSAVAADNDGDFAVVWNQGRYLAYGSPFVCESGIGMCIDLGAYTVQLQRYDAAGAAVGGARVLMRSADAEVQALGVPLLAGSEPDNVDIAMAPNGAFVVVWNRLGYALAPLSGTYAQTFDAEGHAGLRRVVSLQQGNQSFPAVAVDAGGSFVVAYRRESRRLNDYSNGVYARLFPRAGIGGGEFRIDDGTESDVMQPAVAMDAAGDFVVAWMSLQPLQQRQIRAQRYATGGHALGGNFRVNVPVPLVSAQRAAVAMDAGGDFVVTWAEDSAVIEARFYDGP